MKKIFLLLLFIGLFQSKLSADYIHEYSIDLYYANGVKANARNSASEDWTYRSNDLKAKYSSLKQALKYGEAKLSYNASYLWGIGDFAEVVIPYLLRLSVSHQAAAVPAAVEAVLGEAAAVAAGVNLGCR